MRDIQYAAALRFYRWRLGILDRPLLRAMTAGTVSSSRSLEKMPRLPAARSAPGWCSNIGPRNQEGAGKAGCKAHPQPRVRNETKHTSVVTTGSPDQPGLPRAMVLTACFALSSVTGLSCHRRRRRIPPTLRQRRGVRTTRLRRPRINVIRRLTWPRPPHPTPNVR